ncbi:3-hydroxyacyl-ACP dehydratase FabZ [Neisseria perflava]|uniref:3-hydroxyacyl-ACP dehydratase FabZ n=1 Tax=Neisseria perflava TaxID=33053 RepID=UPI0020A20E5A|nr:3-hydroxyacyl-ACP dehydratase FabZ [Neisseria perflava]MCP1660492.1 3-hydroxyacyl-[acyl-carrier-protein] dehydratase [Neisseria perflava]MCP1772041.1 3-hydroxyacyl-[acyl-carrier-protein] dehydratase [Neisseria perflava]
MEFKLPIEAKDIHNLIPHRYPFMLIDRIVAFESMKTLTAIKNVSMNEPQFQGHFPGLPTMPGVLIIEGMAQACGTLAILSNGGREENEFFFFAGIDDARFKRQVIPGDQLTYEVELLTFKRGIGKFHAVAKVEGQIAAEAVIMCAKRIVAPE